jgi:hypothetical protein
MGARVGAQKRLTNIALVKYKKHGHKFELACYRNTVMAWRNKACAPSLLLLPQPLLLLQQPLPSGVKRMAHAIALARPSFHAACEARQGRLHEPQ